MDKKSGPLGAGSKAISGAASSKAKADSEQAGERGRGVWLNEQGELCIGSSCFAIAIKPGTNEVRVRIDRNECGAELQPFIDSLLGEVIQGAPTVYETKSKRKDVK